jgi:hypothetical protein
MDLGRRNVSPKTSHLAVSDRLLLKESEDEPKTDRRRVARDFGGATRAGAERSGVL